MKRVFGVKKDKEPPPSLNDASDRISRRGESVDEKIKRLNGELARYKEQIKRTRPGPAQEAVKARAMRVLKQKRVYERQRDMLYNQTFNLDQVAFALEGIKDAQQTELKQGYLAQRHALVVAKSLKLLSNGCDESALVKYTPASPMAIVSLGRREALIQIWRLTLINKRGESVDEKIKRLDGELARYKEQIKRTRPGPAQEAVKARAMRVLKQKRMYEGQRDMLYNQTFNLDQVAFASEGIKDAQQTMSALKSANKELKGMMKTVKIQDIDNLQDDMVDLMEVSNEIQESLGRSYSVPDDIDEEDLMGELDALEADMGLETESEGVPSYLQPDNEPDLSEELNLPSAPSGHAVPARRVNNQAEDDFGLPPVPRASLRG
ncbi:hypothetical protein OSB04_025723 [Centaurea solstitialis]|uniref:Uncharacterized protein n=1 Tax=Centaurea solstitialis TaxID=347529 RepID=A0AA38T1Z8_9ASTR|nr:hypothetical protein OSB04_025723 [Centaurea solstitialis]